jgi:uncharacterized membrane protein
VGEQTPILPAHIEETIQAIAQLHARHYREATPVQRAVDHMTHIVGRPRFVGFLTAAIMAWVGLNAVLQLAGRAAFDPAPFGLLMDVCTLLGLFITVLILITQRRENMLTEHREQLTLELAILSEQKNAKIIQLLEEMRRDDPLISNRVDREAEALSVPADPQAVLDAIKDSHEEMMANVQGEEAPAVPAASETG